MVGTPLIPSEAEVFESEGSLDYIRSKSKIVRS